jgi:hypothetical protein
MYLCILEIIASSCIVLHQRIVSKTMSKNFNLCHIFLPQITANDNSCNEPLTHITSNDNSCNEQLLARLSIFVHVTLEAEHIKNR